MTREIMFVIAAPFIIGVYLMVARKNPLCTIPDAHFWALASFCEGLLLATVLASWASGIPCFRNNCATSGCSGYTVSAILWISTISATALLYPPLRYLNVLPGVINRPLPGAVTLIAKSTSDGAPLMAL